MNTLTDIILSLFSYLIILALLLAPVVAAIVIISETREKKKQNHYQQPTQYRPQQYQQPPQIHVVYPDVKPDPSKFNRNHARWESPRTEPPKTYIQEIHIMPSVSTYEYMQQHQHHNNPVTEIQKPIPNKNTEKYQNAYEAVDILTKNEKQNYRTLKEAADRKGYIICPKVRLADIIKPRNDPEYMARFGKIKSKHVDFVIYNEDMSKLKAVIELDDSSHDRPDRIERDEFVDFILQNCGYKVIHTRYITPDILDNV